MVPRQKPYRAKGEVSQSFNDGMLVVHAVTDGAQEGRRPVARLKPVVSLRFSNRRLGIERYYAGMQNQIKVERVVRVQRRAEINSQMVVILSDSPGTAYRIDLVQEVFDAWPDCYDLTLVKFEQRFEVIA